MSAVPFRPRCARLLGLGLLLSMPVVAAPLPHATAQPTSTAAVNPLPAVVPGLREWQGGRGVWRLSADSRIVLAPAQASTLQPLAAGIAADLNTLAGLRPSIVIGGRPRDGDLLLCLDTPGQADPWHGPEAYALELGATARLRASTTRGLFYASRSLLQMMLLSAATGAPPRSAPQGRARDYPRYRERALSLDVARKFAEPRFLLEYLRFMGWYKLNTLHLHLDDQVRSESGDRWLSRTFRLKSEHPGFAGLMPADGKTYDRADWDQLEAVAAANGISLVPEIDTPGHAGALVIAHPELAYPGDKPQGGTLDPGLPGSLPYVESLFDEFLPWFRGDTVHIGGDEVNVNDGKISLATQVDYLNRLGHYLQQRGKRVELWGSADMAATLDKSFVIQRWINWGEEARFQWHQHGFAWTESFGDWYVVPFGPSYFNPGGLRGQVLYDGWDSRIGVDADSADAPQGGQIALWNDRGERDYDYPHTVHGLLKEAVPTAGQLFWQGRAHAADGMPLPYQALRRQIERLQYGPRAGALSAAGAL